MNQDSFKSEEAMIHDPLAAVGAAVPTPFLSQYQPQKGFYDEIYVAPGELRPHWRTMAEALNRMGGAALTRRWAQAQRMVHENGIAYSAYGDPTDKPRPWHLDPLPLLIPHVEWSSLAVGLKQRAHLLNLILADLYGPQTLINTGALPPEIIFAHPGFRLPYHGQHPESNCFLHLYAADLGRSPNGSWWVLADRSDAPSGSGFALENRIVISRMFPVEFQQCNVQRLAPYFIALRDKLQSLSKRNKENPHVVLLSEGPTTSNYFEDAYLARYLGFTLVEDEDLAVRKNQVVLKTLGGLVPVDVILRRPNSERCDPLELPGQNASGIAGILQVARQGNVAIANTLGSGIVESPIFLAFLPQLCQLLLGEELKLPGVATWWCGNPQALEYVLTKLDQLVIKRAFRTRGEEFEIVKKLNQMQTSKRAELIKANPTQYVAQEKVTRSSAAIWDDGAVRTSYVALRTFLVASGDSFELMSGGLTRTSAQTDSLEVSLLAGEGSKDTWILGATRAEHVSLLQKQGESIQIRRNTGYLPSRVADNFCWLGRYLERAEAAARLLRAVTIRLTGESSPASLKELPLLIRALASEGLIDPGFAVEGIRDQLPEFERMLPGFVFDRTERASMRSLLDETFRLASKVRDRLTLDTWRIVLRLDEGYKTADVARCDLAELLNLTNQLVVDLAAFSGIIAENMTRTQAFRFLDLGRRLERGLQMISLVKSYFIDVEQISNEALEAVLEIGDSLMTYRSRYFANLQLVGVLDLLLIDETNPRSLAYQLVALNGHIEALPKTGSGPGYSKQQRLSMSALHAIRMAEISEICQQHALGEQTQLRSLIETIEEQLTQISIAVSNRYLVHTGPVHQLIDSRVEPA